VRCGSSIPDRLLCASLNRDARSSGKIAEKKASERLQEAGSIAEYTSSLIELFGCTALVAFRLIQFMRRAVTSTSSLSIRRWLCVQGLMGSAVSAGRARWPKARDVPWRRGDLRCAKDRGSPVRGPMWLSGRNPSGAASSARASNSLDELQHETLL
jgi:hypothetical protein